MIAEKRKLSFFFSPMLMLRCVDIMVVNAHNVAQAQLR